MSYKITQHRRGTYEEWLELDIVPLQGELIIVEFDNNVYKCKIGDGETCFSQLPYITDWLAEELISEISSATQALKSDVDSIAEDLHRIDETVSTLVEPAVGELDTKYSKKLSQIVEQHSADQAAIYKAISDANEELALTNRDTLSTLYAEVDEKISSRIAASELNTSASIQDVVDAISSINNTIEQLQNKNTNTRSASTLSEQAVNSSKELTDIIEQIEDLQYKVIALETGASVTKLDLQNISLELSRLATSITGLSNQQKAGFNNLSAAITTLETKLSTADSDISSVVTSHIATVNDEIAKLSAADTLLYQVIYKIQDTLIKKIDSADEAIRAELSDDVARINESIVDAKLMLDDQFAQAQNGLAESLAAIKVELNKKLTNFEKLYDTRLAANESAILSLSNTISSGQTSLTDTVENLSTEVINNSTNITNNSVAIGRLSTELANKSALINASIDATNVKIDNQAVNLENKFMTKIEATDSTVQSQAESLLNLNDKLDDLLEDIDNRIVSKILENKSDVTASITEIREAVKQIKLIIDQAGIPSSETTAEIIANISRINDEIIDLAADDVILYQVMYRIRDELLAAVNDIQSGTQSEVNNKIAAVNDTLASMQSKLDADLNSINSELSESITNVDSKATAKADSLERIILSKTADNANAISSLTDIVNKNNTATSEALGVIAADVASNKSSITVTNYAVSQVNSALENKATALGNDIDLLDSRLDAQEKRISSIVALESGSTTGDAELLDIRTGYNGEIHSSAGDAVRNIGSKLQKLENSLSQYIDTQAIDGLRYDYSGEVGLMQPYMLYLTAGGEVIQDSGVQIISGSGGGGGGGSSATSTLKIGYITQSPVVVTPSDKAMIYFTFSGTDSSGDILQQASATWKADGKTVEHGVVRDGENEFDATKYIKTGTTKILLTVTDDNGSVATKTWSVQQIELTIDSNFNDKRSYPAGESIVFDYIPSGAIQKTVVFKLDDKIIDRVQLGKEVSGSVISYELPAQPHGSHLLDIYLEADLNGDTVTSNHKLKDILWYNSAAATPVIGTSTQSINVKQYSTTNIIYTVYDPSTETPTVKIEVDGIVVATPVVKPNKDYGNTPTDVYSYTATTAGMHTIKIICGDAKKTINVFVEDIGISVAPVTTGLAFDFNPVGRSNGDANRLWNYNDISMFVSDNFDWVNGGYIPEDPDGPCFCIKAGSSATINYELFANEAKVSGKEFKLIFKTKNISNPDAVFLSCIDNTTDKDHIGISMGVHNANIYGKNGNLELAYSEEDTIEFEFNISKDTEAVPMVMGYEDGVPSRPMVYDGTYSFKQNNPKIITLGSPDCDLYIYRFKVYNTSLSAANILQNFIADARTAEEIVNRYNRNQIYDENTKLTAESLSEKCPWLRVYKLSAPHFTNNKSDKVSDTTVQQIYHRGDPKLDNWVAHNAQHSGQGTSSNNYGAAGRNLDFIMNKSNSYFELGDGTIADKITLTRDSVPTAYLNAKVNIASSNNITNAILANRYNRFNPYHRPFVREDTSIIDKIKDTMEFYNCAIFIQETDPDLTTHREFADTDWHFYAIGNIGDSKKTDNTRLTDQNDPYECCVEIMDVGLPLSSFPRDTMINAMGYSVDEKTGERNYTWAKDSNLGILYEKQEDGSYVLTTDTSADLDKTYYVDILEHDDFSEDYTYGWRYISDDEDSDIVNTCKQAWIDFYRFVTTSSDEEFKANLKNYFAVDSALYYYLFTTRYCMVDNRAKNTFWHYGKSTDGTRKWDLCWDYDND